MTKLEKTIQTVLNQQMSQLSESTFTARRCYYNQLLRTASFIGINEPCQKLYNAFVSDDYGSKDRGFQLAHCAKLIDKCAETHALRKDGTFGICQASCRINFVF